MRVILIVGVMVLGVAFEVLVIDSLWSEFVDVRVI